MNNGSIFDKKHLQSRAIETKSVIGSFEGARRWIYAPAPEYPMRERQLRQEGTVIVAIKIGADGRVELAGIARSSGNANLDNAALAAVRTWRTHKEYAGLRAVIPVTFELSKYRR